MITTKHHPFKTAEHKKEYMSIHREFEKQWPPSRENRMITTRFGTTHVRVNGPVKAPALVLLPGALSCSLSWLPNIQELSKTYRTYAVDTLINTGCVGLSVYSQAITTPDDAVLWLNELFAGLQLKECKLAGMSYGGMLAAYYAIKHSEKLNKLILIAPAFLPIHWKFIIKAIPALFKSTKESYSKFLHWHLAIEDLQNNQKELMEGIINMLATSRQCFEKIDYLEPRTFTIKELQNITVPTYLVVGEKDRSYPVAKAIKSLKKAMPKWKIESIPHAGHGLPMTHPEIVNRKIIDLL